MTQQEQAESPFSILHYRLDDGEVGRVKYEPNNGERRDGEIFRRSQGWSPRPAETVPGEGEQTGQREAKELVRRLGGRLGGGERPVRGERATVGPAQPGGPGGAGGGQARQPQ